METVQHLIDAGVSEDIILATAMSESTIEGVRILRTDANAVSLIGLGLPYWRLMVEGIKSELQ